MRKFHEYRDEARGMTAGLCALLAVAVVGTVVVSALALAGVSVASTYAYLSATTNIKMPVEHWRGVFFHRLGETGILTALLVGGAAVYTWFRLADGGGGWVARSLGGTRITSDAVRPRPKATHQHRRGVGHCHRLARPEGLSARKRIGDQRVRRRFERQGCRDRRHSRRDRPLAAAAVAGSDRPRIQPYCQRRHAIESPTAGRSLRGPGDCFRRPVSHSVGNNRFEQCGRVRPTARHVPRLGENIRWAWCWPSRLARRSGRSARSVRCSP